MNTSDKSSGENKTGFAANYKNPATGKSARTSEDFSEQSKKAEEGTAFLISACTKKELRIVYGLSAWILRGWLDAVPECSGTGRKNWLSAAQVEAFVRKYGYPKIHQENGSKQSGDMSR